MPDQNFSNHTRMVPVYHYFLALLLLAIIIGSVINVFGSAGTDGFYSATLILAMSIALLFAAFFARFFPLKAQDRIIRLEEEVRFRELTGKSLDPRLSMRQIIAARFASDEELPELLERAITEGLSEKDIKQAIKNWRADHARM